MISMYLLFATTHEGLQLCMFLTTHEVLQVGEQIKVCILSCLLESFILIFLLVG